MEVPELRYEVLVYWSDEDAAFIAEVPNLPGCLSDGETPAEAVENALDAARGWIATAHELGRAIPPPVSRLRQAV